ncbi:conserved hypothetical protein [Alteromonadaceae bacterium Bs31]|nr:conserved hypothetical protein [Alteromonadaceae bacterium Bs31]
MGPFRHILEQHVEDASFLWVLRSHAVNQPHYNYAEISELERRIENNLDGIMTSLSRAWPICIDACAFEEGGEAFVLAVTAFRSLEMDKIKTAVDFGFLNDDTYKGLVSALAWLPGRFSHEWIKKFFSSKDLRHKTLALNACSLRSEDPGAYLNRILERDDCIANEALYSRALRCIGEFKRQDLAPLLSARENCEEASEPCFWSLWSSILLGEKGLANSLEPFVLTENPCREKAISLAFRVLPLDVAKAWISKLAEDEQNMRLVIKATAALGDPQAVTWLIQLMRNPLHARLSAEAFCFITGIDIESRELVLDVPDITVFEIDEEKMEDVSLDEDEHLPWPDTDRLAIIWEKYGSNMSPGQRYFMGKPVNVETCKTIVRNGTQRQRSAAAFELALLDSQMALINVKARCVPLLES